MSSSRLLVTALLGAVLPLNPVAAKVPAAEAARLGQDLTPVGAERAGNADGSIPEWTPGEQQGATSGHFPADAVLDAQQPLFAITRANLAQYKDKLTEGHKALLSKFDSYKLNVYPSHRRVTWPQPVLQATAANATTAVLEGTDRLRNATLGFPFPIPRSGAEVIWNHKLKWRGETAVRYNNQLIVQPDGRFQPTKIIEEVKFYYASIKNPIALGEGSTLFLKYLSQTISPPRVAGTFILVHEKSGVGTAGRDAWLYSPGLKRIRRAPTVCCDNPSEGTDGHQVNDQVDMFNGTLERYTWKLVGKREIYIPHNSHRIGSPAIKFKDVARPRHLNQDLPRYELHRVWAVEATLKPGTSHIFSKRVFYVEEDGWSIVAVDCYDARGQLYQFQEGHQVFLSNILSSATVPEVIYHFDSGRYFITAAATEGKAPDFTRSFDENFFEANSVQKRTTR